MSTCASCGSQLPEAGRFCSSCGAVVVSQNSPDDLATMDFVDSKPRQSGRTSSGAAAKAPSSSGGLLIEGRFLPGRLLRAI